MLTLNLKHKRWMEAALSLQIDLVGLLWSWVATKIGSFSCGNSYLRHPFLSRFADSCKTMLVFGIEFSLVARITQRRYVSKIRNSVVRSNAVDMVNLLIRPTTINVEPRKPMRWMALPVDSDANVSLVADCLCNCSGKPLARPPAIQPSEQPGFWVVVEQLFELLLRQRRIKISHAVSPEKKWFGQKPARVDSTGGLRYFTACSVENTTECMRPNGAFGLCADPSFVDHIGNRNRRQPACSLVRNRYAKRYLVSLRQGGAAFNPHHET